MKKQYHKNLRYSQKIRQNQCFIEADGLQKKIRKFNANKIQGPINAEMKMRQIQCFWKEGWEYNHTHHIYLQPKITRPQFYYKNPQKDINHQALKNYYKILQKYIKTLKAQNEDETNFKIDQILCNNQKSINQKNDNQMEIEGSQLVNKSSVSQQQIIKSSVDHLIKITEIITNQMIQNFHQCMFTSQDYMLEQQLQEVQIQDLQRIQQFCKMYKNEYQSYQQKYFEIEEFIKKVIEITTKAKQEKIYSGILSLQPSMGILSQIYHPLSLAFYSTFMKQVLIKHAKKLRGRRYADEPEQELLLSGKLMQDYYINNKLLKITDNYKIEQQKHSRILFINLDGYETQYNLQLMRNFSQNIMYVSFPKYSRRQSYKHYNYRFYKKMMYNYTRSQTDIFGVNNDNIQDINISRSKQQILLNPQKYQQTIDKIYQQHDNFNKPWDMNKNIYIFPINMSNLISQKIDNNIQGYQNQFVRFIFRDHLYTAIKSYKPTYIFISYTGKIDIQNDHFVEIIQQLVKICPKICLFPNYTIVVSNLKDNKIYQNCSILHKKGSKIIQNRQEQNNSNICNFEQLNLLQKFSIFLKITAGFYNVLRPFQQEQLQSKYKHSQVFGYIINLYDVLKHQFGHCKRRIQSNMLQVSRASLQKSINQYSKDLQNCVPIFYKQLFQQISGLLEGKNHCEEYKDLVEQVHSYFIEINQQNNSYLFAWQELKKAEFLQLASAKYHQISQIQIRQKLSQEQYTNIRQQKENNLDSLFRISYCYKDKNDLIVKLFKETTLLYRQNQVGTPKGSYFHVILSNLFTSSQQEIHHFIAKPKLSNRRIQRCNIIPIVFHTRQGIVKQRNKFKIWTQWSYTQTNNHLLLYWPSQFDYVNYYLNKVIKRRYEPNIIHRIFAAYKSKNALIVNEDNIFYEVNFGDNIDVEPRWGCSGINLDDQLYIFGGNYSADKSYLNMQNDVTTLDLTDHDLKNFAPTKLRNLRKELYCDNAFYGKLREKRNVNTFIRPRLQFQFYQQEELVEKKQETGDQYKRIYMIGGYGDQFRSPYSLFVNYFYELTFQRLTRRLISIRKKDIPQKVIPINIRSMIKNRGSYQKANILENGQANQQQRCKQGMTNNRHYFHHHVVYAIRNGQLQFKIKNLFAVELYENSKKDFYSFGRKVGEVRPVEQQQTILIRKIEGSNHQLLVQIEDTFYVYSLYLSLLINNEFIQIPLMNESIISLDTKKLVIYALINHPKYTQNKYVLVSQAVKLPQQSIIDRQKHYALTLKQLITFNQNLGLHCLLICNPHEIVLLHGIGFQGCKRTDYHIKIKQNRQTRSEQILPQLKNPKQYENITSFFVKKNNIINSINFLQERDHSQSYGIVYMSLDLVHFTRGWKIQNQIKRVRFTHENLILQRISIEARIDNYSDLNSMIIILYANKHVYHVRMADIIGERVEVKELIDKKEIEKYKCMDSILKIFKNQELYQDFDYF